MNILGISAFYHDAAACLLRDGEIVAAASEERFTRKKHDAGFPEHSIRYVLGAGGIGVGDIDYVGFYDKPLLKFERILTTYVATFPKSFSSFRKAIPLWLKDKLWVPNTIRKTLDYDGEILFAEHHMSHAASAFLVSPFKKAAIMTLDGVGEWATATRVWARTTQITLLNEIRFPHSLGLLYSAFTYFLGFKVNSAEYKVMGLAPYGEPKYYDTIMNNLIHVAEDGSFKMNMDYFAYDYGLTMTNGRSPACSASRCGRAESKLEQVHKDLARLGAEGHRGDRAAPGAPTCSRSTGMTNLCMAGGVALNCVANGTIIRETPFKDIFVQPAAGDAGGAVGVAASIYHACWATARTQLASRLSGAGVPHRRDPLLLQTTAAAVSTSVARRSAVDRQPADRASRTSSAGSRVGWSSARARWGIARILADARNPANRDTVNLKIKFRESFRPFAPTVLEERCAEWFELGLQSPYMLLVAQVRARQARPSRR